jgi:crossover junction endodeoxyribonuclease RusA
MADDEWFQRNAPIMFAGLVDKPLVIKLTLPWPHKDLSPNGRAHHFAKARAAKAARLLAWGLTLEAMKGRQPTSEAIALHWDFHPKTANLPDGDNAEASVKAYRDGIADALGINDAKFTATRTIGQPVKGGAVNVTVREA